MITDVLVEVNMVVGLTVLKNISEKKISEEIKWLNIHGVEINSELFDTDEWTINEVKIIRIE